VALFYALVTLDVVYSVIAARRQKINEFAALLISSLAAATLGRLFGPFVLMPLMISAYAIGLVVLPRLVDRSWLVIVIALATFLAPIALGMTDVIASTWAVDDDQLVITSRAIRFNGAGTAARVRVLIESTDGKRRWGTVGVSNNVIEASWQALVDSVEYKLHRDHAKARPRVRKAAGAQNNEERNVGVRTGV